MKKLTLIILFFAIILNGCSKEGAEQIECESLNIGYMDITNTSSNPYAVYVDGSLHFILYGNTYKNDYELSVGSHEIIAEQQSGYLLFPTVRTLNTYITECNHSSWVFP